MNTPLYNEELLTLDELSKKVNRHRSTLHRYATQGVISRHGEPVVLETVTVANRMHSSMLAWKRWIEAQNVREGVS